MDDMLKEQMKRLKKTIFPIDTNPEEAIKRVQEINDILEFFESSAVKLTKKELDKDIIVKNLIKSRQSLSETNDTNV